MSEELDPALHPRDNDGTFARPVLDPAVGSEANEEVAQARRAVLGELSAGDLTLGALFEAVDRESDDEHRQLGHIHLRAALLALPRIGEVRADEIIAAVNLERDRHLASLGSHQKAKLVELVEAIQG